MAKTDNPTLRHYIGVIVKWRKIVIFNVLLITILAIVISLVLPKKFTSTTTILPPTTTGSELLGGTSALSGALAQAVGISGVVATTPSDLFAAMLKSRTVMKGVIDDCNLRRIYGDKDVYEKLEECTEIIVKPEGIIELSTTDRSPKRARSMAIAYVKHLDQFNKSVIMSTGKKNRIFLEERLDKVEKELREAEEALKSFQESHKTISIEHEITPILEAVSSIKAQIISKKVMLDATRRYATEQNPEVIRLKSEIQALEKRLHDLEYKGDASHFGIGFSIPFKEIPQTSIELARFAREVMVQEQVFTLLTQEYEKAKIQEVKDTPTVEILDEANLPERKSFPRRTQIVVISFVCSLFLGLLLAFFFEYLEKMKDDKEEYKEWKDIVETIKSDFKKIRKKKSRK
jgi:tyrosine-protein kinase Etk/Wzc